MHISKGAHPDWKRGARSSSRVIGPRPSRRKSRRPRSQDAKPGPAKLDTGPSTVGIEIQTERLSDISLHTYAPCGGPSPQALERWTKRISRVMQDFAMRVPKMSFTKRASYEAISRARSRKGSTGPRGGASRSNPSLKGCSAQRIETQHKIAASASASATIATNWNRQHAAKRTTLWNSLMLP